MSYNRSNMQYSKRTPALNLGGLGLSFVDKGNGIKSVYVPLQGIGSYAWIDYSIATQCWRVRDCSGGATKYRGVRSLVSFCNMIRRKPRW